MPSARPNHVGIRAVGWMLPVRKKLTRPSTTSRIPKMIVVLAKVSSVALPDNAAC
jgi:hypothetical protein